MAFNDLKFTVWYDPEDDWTAMVEGDPRLSDMEGHGATPTTAINDLVFVVLDEMDYDDE